MNKKGITKILFVLFEVIIVVAVILIIIVAGKDMASSDRVTRTLAAEDFRMMIHTLSSVEGEATLKYPYKTSKDITAYTIVANQNSVTVKTSNNDVTKATRSITVPEGYNVVGAVREVESFCLTKKNKNILINYCDDDKDT